MDMVKALFTLLTFTALSVQGVQAQTATPSATAKQEILEN